MLKTFNAEAIFPKIEREEVRDRGSKRREREGRRDRRKKGQKERGREKRKKGGIFSIF